MLKNWLLSPSLFLASRNIPRWVNINRTAGTSPIRLNGLDHVCIVSSNMKRSIDWYNKVLGLVHVYKEDDNFYPVCADSPAFLTNNLNGGAKVALLPITFSQQNKRVCLGEHFALNVDREEFKRAQVELPKLLSLHAPNDVDIETADYGHQLSLFVNDPDKNVVEITTWISPHDNDRL